MARNFEPGFYVEHFIKDMGIALAEAEKMNLALPGLALAKQLYESLRGHRVRPEGDAGINAGVGEHEWGTSIVDNHAT